MLSTQSDLKDQVSHNNAHSLEEYKGLSRSVSWLSIVWASAKMNLTIWKRYKANAIGSIVQIVLFILFFGLFSVAIGFRGFEEFTQREIFIFFLGGLILVFYDGVAIYSPLNTTIRDMTNGTLEQIYFIPSSKYGYFVGYIVGNAFVTTMIAIVPLFIFTVIYASIPLESVIMIILILLVILGNLIAIGVLVALTAILWKQVQGLVGLIGIVIQFMTGAFIPVQSLPQVLQGVAWFFPHTWAYELIRYYSFENWQLILPLEITWLLLFFYLVLYTLLAKFLLGRVEKHARKKGLHLL